MRGVSEDKYDIKNVFQHMKINTLIMIFKDSKWLSFFSRRQVMKKMARMLFQQLLCDTSKYMKVSKSVKFLVIL